MEDRIVRRFLRYYWSGLVDYALDLAELDDDEREAVILCGRKRMSVEKAAEYASVPVSPNTMRTRWKNARLRLSRAWHGIEWIHILADQVEE